MRQTFFAEGLRAGRQSCVKLVQKVNRAFRAAGFLRFSSLAGPCPALNARMRINRGYAEGQAGARKSIHP